MLANRFAPKENWSRASSEWNRVKARAGDLPMVVLCLLAFCALPSANRAQVPVYEVTPVESTIKFDVGSSVPIKGTFDKWNASMKFSSTDVRSGVLDIDLARPTVEKRRGQSSDARPTTECISKKAAPPVSTITSDKLSEAEAIQRARDGIDYFRCP